MRPKQARKRYRTRDESRLRDLIDFAEGRVNVSDGRKVLIRVLDGLPGYSPLGSEHGDAINQWPDAKITEIGANLQKFARTTLRARNVFSQPKPRQPLPLSTIEVGPFRYTVMPIPQMGKGFEGLNVTMFLYIDGETKDLVWYAFLNLLRSVGLSNIRACAADDCDSIYVRVGRREFCSDRCQRRIYMRGLRERGREKKTRRSLQRKGKAR